MIPTPRAILPDVIEAVETAGRMVAAEFCRPGGPRFSDHVTAPVDHEIELFLRDRLTGLLPARFVGEEAGVLDAPANGFCWVVDPHDGTRAFLEGRRGSAVSVALLREGQPVIGVVFAPLSPDRGPDLIAWAEGSGNHPQRPSGNDRPAQAGRGCGRRGVPEPRRLAAAGVARHCGGARPVHAAAVDRLSAGTRGGGRRHRDTDAAAGQRARRGCGPCAAVGRRRRAGGRGWRAGHLHGTRRKPAVGVFRRCAGGSGDTARADLARQHRATARASRDC